MSDTTNTTTGITLRCPCCDAEASVRLHLDDVNLYDCQDCGDEFDADQVRAMVEEMQGQLGRWQKVLAWADQMPRD